MSATIKWISLVLMVTVAAACSKKEAEVGTVTPADDAQGQIHPTPTPLNLIEMSPCAPEGALSLHGPMLTVAPTPEMPDNGEYVFNSWDTFDEGEFGDFDPAGTELNEKPLIKASPILGYKDCASQSVGIHYDPLLNNALWRTNIKQINFCVDGMVANVYTTGGLQLNKNANAYITCDITNSAGDFHHQPKMRLRTHGEEIVKGQLYRFTTEGNSTQFQMGFKIDVRELLTGTSSSVAGCAVKLEVRGRQGRDSVQGDITIASKIVKNWRELDDLDALLKRPDLTQRVEAQFNGMCLGVDGTKRTNRNGTIIRMIPNVTNITSVQK